MPNRKEATEGGGESTASGSLWDPFHDALLQSVVSDRLAREVTFEFDIEHLRRYGGLAEDVRWRLIVERASHLMARTWQIWPGPCPSMEALTRQEESRVINDHHARRRTVSVAWEEFERVTGRNSLDIDDITLTVRPGSQTLSGYGRDVEEDGDFEFEVVGEAVRCERSDVGPGDLDELVSLGERYWQAFAARRPTTDAG